MQIHSNEFPAVAAHCGNHQARQISSHGNVLPLKAQRKYSASRRDCHYCTQKNESPFTHGTIIPKSPGTCAPGLELWVKKALYDDGEYSLGDRATHLSRVPEH